MSDEFFYKEISPEAVDSRVRAVAEKVLSYCKGALGLQDKIKIQWVEETDRASANLDNSFVKLEKALRRMIGDCSEVKILYRKDNSPFYGQMGGTGWLRDKIMVRADVQLREILLTVAHELKHISDFGPNGKYRPPLSPEECKLAEQRAEHFAGMILERMKYTEDLKIF
jgi:hypothetical protein